MASLTASLLRAPVKFSGRGTSVKLLSTIAADKNAHFKVLVAGGGTSGCAVAAQLKDMVSNGDIGIIEPNEDHYYQAAWTLVGAGIMTLPQTRIPTREAIPKHSIWIHDKIASFDPLNNRIFTSGGRQITYDYLVVCLGISLRPDMIKGAQAALDEDARVCTNYSADYVEKTFKAIQNFKQGGTAIFTLPNTPIKCAGAPQKVMYLFEDYLVRNNKKKDTNILYFTATKTLFSVKKYSDALEKICQQRGIIYNLCQNLVEVDHKRSIAVLEDVNTKQKKEYKYDLLHLTPPMAAPEVIKTGKDLGDPEAGGFVNVDSQTLRHVKYGNIFALGDCSSLPVSKTAAAVSSQGKVLCANLADVMKGGSGKIAVYNGYTSCPLITGYQKGILAEFNYDLEPMETLPIDQSRERALFAWIKKSVLPPLYWNGLIRGIWKGPSTIRSIFHFGRSR